jgi:hypothetical protein
LECQRNVELMWLARDFKTITDFCRDNGPAIRCVSPTSASARKAIAWKPSAKANLDPDTIENLLTAIAKARSWMDDLAAGRGEKPYLLSRSRKSCGCCATADGELSATQALYALLRLVWSVLFDISNSARQCRGLERSEMAPTRNHFCVAIRVARARPY